MKFAICQINPTVGDINGNLNKIISFIDKAKENKADVAIFPELAITGYSPLDLLESEEFINANLKAVEKLCKFAFGITIILGFVDKNTSHTGKRLFNAAGVLSNGKISSIHYKTLLPDHDVFDECRYFEPARINKPTRINNKKVALVICEDMWQGRLYGMRKLYHRDPLEELANVGFDIIINISASPYHIGKEKIRNRLIISEAKRWNKPVISCNQVGGNDDLVFDGTSIAVDSRGEVIGQAKSFEEDIVIVDLDSPTKVSYKEYDDVEMVYKALVLGVKDYVRKCGFKKVVIGLSGGIDSSLVACIAKDALGKENVLGVSMPTIFSSKSSYKDSEKLAKNLGIKFKVIDIQPIFESYLNLFKKIFKDSKFSVAEENIQARIRANILMSISNKEGYLLLSCGNKSELATGYVTLYGDMCGGLAVISDVPKTLVYEIVNKVVNKEKKIIPEEIIEKEPSAELKPNQKDTDTLPPYNVLDKIIKLYIEDKESVKEIMKKFNKREVEKVIKMIENNEFKRRQAPPGIKVTPKSLGIGRKYPIAKKIHLL
jgi:NAD+ synthase (glutamine-hydrolysing)